MSWPVEVLELEARHIKKRRLGSGNHRCFISWLEHWFNCDSPEYQMVLNIAQRLTGTMCIVGWNDDYDRTEAEIAKMINKVTAEAAYNKETRKRRFYIRDSNE